MKLEDVDPKKQADGEYCRKGFPNCFCDVGWPYELQCERCRDTRPQDDLRDWCYNGGFCWSHKEREEMKP